jgi:tRNA pseudouridine55 synthase
LRNASTTLNTNPPAGLLLIDKPAGITSFDIIRQLRRATGIRKIGHAGTLDPMATGLMLMLIGAATKRAGRLSGLDKTYVAEMTLGAVSSTGDREGELTAVSDREPTESELIAALEGVMGEITQVPPQYAAIKVGGVRAYKLARQGKIVVMPPRQVSVHRINLLSYAYPLARFEAQVSSGTYVRSLARDIGETLGTGAYLSDLSRTEVGEYRLGQSQPLETITATNLSRYLIPI